MELNLVDPNIEHGNDAIGDRIEKYDPTVVPLIPSEPDVEDSTEYLNNILSVTVR